MLSALFRRGTAMPVLIVAWVAVSLDFAVAGNSDSHNWRALTTSAPELSGFVSCMTTFEGELIAAGGFAMAGNDTLNSIARWDGTGWRALVGGTNRPIWCLAVYRGELIAGGEFTLAGGSSANGIARWTGSQWMPLGSGVRGATPDEWAQVVAMVEYDGRLIVGGRFSHAGDTTSRNIACWDGIDWQPVPCSHSGDVQALAVFGRHLIASRAADESGSGAVVLRYDGGDNWAALGSCDSDTKVGSLFRYGNSLIAGGTFSRIGAVEAAGIASWDGTEWQPLGAGIGQSVWYLGAFESRLIAAGANGAIASWNGINWEGLGAGLGGDINSCLEFAGKLVVAGAFKSSGQVPASHIVVWDKSSSLADQSDK